MEKDYILNYLNSQINVLESLKISISDDHSLSLIKAKLDTLNDIIETVNKAPISFDLI